MTQQYQADGIAMIMDGIAQDVLDSADHTDPNVVQVFDEVKARTITPAEGIARLKSYAAASNLGKKSYTPRVEMGRNRHHGAYVDGCVNMILARNKMAEKGSDYDSFIELTAPRMANDVLRMHGMGISANPLKNITRALSTDDFSNILDNVASKSMTHGYDMAPETWPIFTGSIETRDYRIFKTITQSELPTPTLTSEGGEVRTAAIGADSAEPGYVQGYQQDVLVSRPGLASDELDTLPLTSAASGRAASRLTGDLVYAALTDNAVLSDNVALFHATHGNLGTPGAPSVSTLDELRGLMGDQTGSAGENLNISPAILVGPRALESRLTVLRGALVDLNDPDPLAGSNYKSGVMAVCTDGRLGPSTTAYFAIANPALFSGINVVSLEGRNKRPMLERIRTPISRDGITYRLTHDVAVVVSDYRTLAKNAGA